MPKLSIADVDFSGKRVLMRVDYNVPMKNGKITSTQRIEASVPTINYVMEHGARSLVLMSHMGRPDGKFSEKDSLKQIVEAVSAAIKRPVTFLEDCVGPEIEARCMEPTEGQVFLLENLRFHIEEEGAVALPDGSKLKASAEKVAEFRASLRKLGDIYVNDAFGTAHRAHSSMVGDGFDIRASGFLMAKEIEYLYSVNESKEHKLAILGGAKVNDKIKLIKNMLSNVNEMIITGGMAFTFLKVLHNMEIGKSLFDAEGAGAVADIIETAKAKGVNVILPVDFICGDKFAEDAKTHYATIESGIPEGWMGLDVGIKTVGLMIEALGRAKVVLWNGPCGVFEFPKFGWATRTMLSAMASMTLAGCTTVIGGGDTASAALKVLSEDALSHISTGGGASMELLEGRILPGVASLCDRA